jgi:hypothetical protein
MRAISLSSILLFFLLSFSVDRDNSTKLYFHFEQRESIQGNWKTIEIEGTGEFCFPSDRMEIQNEKLKALCDSVKSRFVIPAPPSKITFQQKGFNNGQNSQYCRFLVEQYNGIDGDFLDRFTKINSLSSNEISVIKENYKGLFQKGLQSQKIEVIKWFPTEVKTMKESICICVKYIRKSVVTDDPDVLVTTYCFPQGHREIDITLACRNKDVDVWKNDFSKIIECFNLYQ